MSETRVKAADIDDWAFLYAVLEVWEEKDMWTSRGPWRGSPSRGWDLAPRFDFRQLLKRGLLEPLEGLRTLPSDQMAHFGRQRG